MAVDECDMDSIQAASIVEPSSSSVALNPTSSKRRSRASGATPDEPAPTMGRGPAGGVQRKAVGPPKAPNKVERGPDFGQTLESAISPASGQFVICAQTQPRFVNLNEPKDAQVAQQRGQQETRSQSGPSEEAKSNSSQYHPSLGDTKLAAPSDGELVERRAQTTAASYQSSSAYDVGNAYVLPCQSTYATTGYQSTVYTTRSSHQPASQAVFLVRQPAHDLQHGSQSQQQQQQQLQQPVNSTLYATSNQLNQQQVRPQQQLRLRPLDVINDELNQSASDETAAEDEAASLVSSLIMSANGSDDDKSATNDELNTILSGAHHQHLHHHVHHIQHQPQQQHQNQNQRHHQLGADSLEAANSPASGYFSTGSGAKLGAAGEQAGESHQPTFASSSANQQPDYGHHHQQQQQQQLQLRPESNHSTNCLSPANPHNQQYQHQNLAGSTLSSGAYHSLQAPSGYYMIQDNQQQQQQQQQQRQPITDSNLYVPTVFLYQNQQQHLIQASNENNKCQNNNSNHNEDSTSASKPLDTNQQQQQQQQEASEQQKLANEALISTVSDSSSSNNQTQLQDETDLIDSSTDFLSMLPSISYLDHSYAPQMLTNAPNSTSGQSLMANTSAQRSACQGQIN